MDGLLLSKAEINVKLFNWIKLNAQDSRLTGVSGSGAYSTAADNGSNKPEWPNCDIEGFCLTVFNVAPPQLAFPPTVSFCSSLRNASWYASGFLSLSAANSSPLNGDLYKAIYIQIMTIKAKHKKHTVN